VIKKRAFDLKNVLADGFLMKTAESSCTHGFSFGWCKVHFCVVFAIKYNKRQSIAGKNSRCFSIENCHSSCSIVFQLDGAKHTVV